MLVMSQKKNEEQSKKYAEDWVPVRSISNGGIQLENGLTVTGVKVTPRNIFILDYDSQNNIIFNLRNLYNAIDFEFWLIVSDRPVDLSLYLSQLQLQFNAVQVPSIRKLISEDIKKAELFMSKEINVADTEYYILFKDKRPEIISKRIRTLLEMLDRSGLNAKQTSDDDLRALLDGFFNGGIKTEFGSVITE